MNGVELHQQIVHDIESAAAKIIRMDEEELYRDLGCDSFADYVEQHLKGVLNQLPWGRMKEQRRRIVSTLYREGQPQRQIAKTMGIAPNTVNRDVGVSPLEIPPRRGGRPRRPLESVPEPPKPVPKPPPEPKMTATDPQRPFGVIQGAGHDKKLGESFEDLTALHRADLLKDIRAASGRLHSAAESAGHIDALDDEIKTEMEVLKAAYEQLHARLK